MSKPSRKKQQRRDKRKKSELARRERFSNRKTAAQQFPQIELDFGNAPAPLANVMRQAVRRIQFENERLFHPHTLFVLRRARTVGFSDVVADIRKWILETEQESFDPDELDELVLDFDHTIGEVLYSLLPHKMRNSYLTFHFILAMCGCPTDKSILVRIRSLCQEKTAGGTIYYSPNRPTVQTDCGEKIVAFSSHALERIYERTVQNWGTYDGNCNAVGFILACNYFESCVLPESDHAFTFYNHCGWGDSVFRHYAEAVLGSLDKKKDYHYRVGYCPAVIERDFLVAKTLLLPGMNKTPEFEWILRREVRSHAEKLALRKRIDGLALKNLAETRDFSLIEHFHKAGIPQVVPFEHAIFRTDKVLQGSTS